MNLEQDIKEIIINGKKAGISSSFYNVLIHLSEQMFGKNTLEGESLKNNNLSNPPTVAFESFNEHLSGKQIPISEDTHTSTLQKTEELCNFNSSNSFSKLPEFSGCFVNNSLISTVKSILSSFENHRNVILTGKNGCGKTQIALWISDHYNKKIDNLNKSFYYVCTEKMNVLDLFKIDLRCELLSEDKKKYDFIGFRDGLLTKAIKQGKCSVLENIDEAPSTVTDLLNKFLDQKYIK